MKKSITSGRDKPTLSENKSNLARLLATENISVRHRPIKTAKFDLKNRVLHCPIWQEMDGNIYDLLMGHEISHALNTPLLGWHDTITNDIKDKSRPKIKSFLNVIEDARIEKIIKRKYPGLRRPFADAYKTLHERDFFGVSKLKGDYSNLRLIDRINLFFKVGAHLQISFDKEEKVFVDRAENIETFEEAAQLARDLYDYAKFKEPEKLKNKNGEKDKSEKDKPEKDKSEKSKKKSKKDSSEDEFDDSESENSDGESEDSDDSEGEDDGDSGNGTDESDDSDGDSEDDGDGESEDSDESEENDNQKPGGKNAGKNEDEINEEPTSETDDSFREQEKDLVNEFGEAILYLDIPKADLKTIIVPQKMVLGKYETSIVAQFQNNVTRRGITDPRSKPMNYSEVASGLNAAFHKRNKAFIGMLVKEFEMRKNANQYARQLTAKTGELDDKKLSRYKLTMDVFRKVTTVTKGKSHGMIMFLDFSGSMSPIIREILEQVLILCTFCRRIGIPFDVYGFGDSHSYNFGVNSKMMFTPVNGGFTFDSSLFNLRHLISSSTSGNLYKKAFTMLNVIGQISNSINRDPDSSACFAYPEYQGNISACGFELGGTPFNETLVASKYIIDEFKKKHHVDITNVIYLSDGDGYGDIRNGNSYSSIPYNELKNTRIGVRDFDSKIGVLTDSKNALSYQSALTRLVAETTNCRHIGYYFTKADHIGQRLLGNTDLKKNISQHMEFLRNNGYVSVPNLGYDNYYYVNTDTMTYRGELMFYPQTDSKFMGQRFIEHQQKKMNSKMIIKEFAADIAE